MLRGNFNDVGGREIHQDDIRILQEELLKAIQLQYVGQGAFILQGCGVTGTAGNYSIGSGLVLINGLVMEFSSVSGITSFPKYIVQASDVPQDSFPLEQGGSAYKRTLIKAELVNSAPGSGEFITMSSSGGRNYNDVLSAQFMRLQGNQVVNGQKTFTSSVISNGLNVNNEINNLNSSLSTKADKSISITGTDGLTGGGDLSTNRAISISNNGVSNSKIADNAVTNTKLANASISPAKLDTDTNNLFRGNIHSDDFSVDFSSTVQTNTRTYSNKTFSLTYNSNRYRPFVKMYMMARGDSSGSDTIRIDLQRSNNPSSGFVTIAQRTYLLTGDTMIPCIVECVDDSAFTSGSNYYRIVATVIAGGNCHMSTNSTGIIYGVRIF